MIDALKGKLHKGPVLLALLAALAVAAVLSVNIRQVTISGNSQYTEQEIVDIIFQKNVDFNSAYFFLKEKTREHIRIPFVEDYQIHFLSPTHVQIIVHEKSVVGYVSYMNSYMYFDKDGIVVESTDQPIDGIPGVTGLKYGHIVLYQPLPVEDAAIFEKILNLTQMLSVRKIKIDRIQYDSRGSATLYFNNVEVILGDSSQMDGKISLLADMMPQIQDLDGILYLDNYDETDEDLISTFKKNVRD